MKPNTIIEIFANFVKVTIFDENKPATIKHTTLDLLQKSLETKTFETPLLPFWSVLYKEKNNITKFLICRPIGRLQYTYSGTAMDLHVPYMYFYHELTKQSGDNFVVKSTSILTSLLPPSDNTKLFVPNINNVGSGSSPCWGTMKKDVEAPFTNLSRLNDIYTIWMNSNRNGDLVNSARMNQANNQTYRSETEFSRAGHVRQAHETSNGFHGRTIKQIKDLL